MDRRRAARFSFLLAVPAIVGAVVFETVKALRTDGVGDFSIAMLTGLLAAAVRELRFCLRTDGQQGRA